MEYMNDLYPYTTSTALACFYTYQKTCILHGEITSDKALVINQEFNFEKKSVVFISDFLNEFGEYPWINKNPYLASQIGRCYYLDFDNERDMQQLGDLFESLADEERVIFNYEKKVDSGRENTLPILIKAFSLALFAKGATTSPLPQHIRL